MPKLLKKILKWASVLTILSGSLLMILNTAFYSGLEIVAFGIAFAIGYFIVPSNGEGDLYVPEYYVES